MIEYFLKLYVDGQDKDEALDINRAYLSVYMDGHETVLIEKILQPTPKGWALQKPLMEELEIVDIESDLDLIISEKSAKMLMAKYADLNVKEYSPPSEGTPRATAIANFITKQGTDPYDRG